MLAFALPESAVARTAVTGVDVTYMPLFDDLPRTALEQNRKAAKRAEEERATRRQREISAQMSPDNDPQRRIQIWEKLHALNLPREPEHTLVRLIARQTGLTVLEVCDEQERRRAASPLA